MATTIRENLKEANVKRQQAYADAYGVPLEIFQLVEFLEASNINANRVLSVFAEQQGDTAEKLSKLFTKYPLLLAAAANSQAGEEELKLALSIIRVTDQTALKKIINDESFLTRISENGAAALNDLMYIKDAGGFRRPVYRDDRPSGAVSDPQDVLAMALQLVG